MDLVETCAQERENTKWRFAYDLTFNVTMFCALLKNIPMGYIDDVLPEHLLTRPDVNCLVSNGYGKTYRDYLCLFRAIAVTCTDHLSWKRMQQICLVLFFMNLDMMQSVLEGYQSITSCLLKMR